MSEKLTIERVRELTHAGDVECSVCGLNHDGRCPYALNTNPGRLVAERDSTIANLARLVLEQAERIATLEGLLRETEWCSDGLGGGWCPFCEEPPPHHADDCRLAAALEAAP
ncbi:MAG: hypothetical protein GY913_21590 [Proteobacteria bacterium]|nr:hypothetical protein [Actinomycetes bacterium]MCP4919503.1 hypothetical protein [Pseudomonadota bacterium]